MPDENRPGENKTTTDDNESLQTSSSKRKLVESKTARPRMRLREVHIRLGHRFFSVWLILSVILGLGVVLVVAANSTSTATLAKDSWLSFRVSPSLHPCQQGCPRLFAGRIY